jgi:hypothetical protein
MSPNQLYTRVFNQVGSGRGEIEALREVAEEGIRLAGPRIAEKRREAIKETKFLIEAPLRPRSGRMPFSGVVRDPAESSAERTVGAARAAVDAASLVFMHSIVDSAAATLLQAISLAAPNDWLRFMDDKKLTVSEVRQEKFKTLYASLLFKELGRIERNTSLPWKAERLLQLCSPEKGWYHWRHDPAELERVDRLRHDIVHGEMFGQELPSVTADLKFLENTGWYLYVIAGKRYRLKLLTKELWA